MNKEQLLQRRFEIKGKIAKFLLLWRSVEETTQTKQYSICDVSFQQGQKWEKANNGISADKFYLICDTKGYDPLVILNSDPLELLDTKDDKGADIFSTKGKDRLILKCKEIDRNILEQYGTAKHYNSMLPKLEKEMAYQNTFKQA